MIAALWGVVVVGGSAGAAALLCSIALEAMDVAGRTLRAQAITARLAQVGGLAAVLALLISAALLLSNGG